MKHFTLFILVCILFNRNNPNGLAIKYFLPFGKDAGDTFLVRNDDGYTNPINLTIAFRFFGTFYTSIFVNTNGLISFMDGYKQYTPSPFPLKTFKGIGPYWTDIDIRYNGNVFYREIFNVDLLGELFNIIYRLKCIAYKGR